MIKFVRIFFVAVFFSFCAGLNVLNESVIKWEALYKYYLFCLCLVATLVFVVCLSWGIKMSSFTLFWRSLVLKLCHQSVSWGFVNSVWRLFTDKEQIFMYNDKASIWTVSTVNMASSLDSLAMWALGNPSPQHPPNSRGYLYSLFI